MGQQAGRANWMDFPEMLRFYEQAQAAGTGLEPDADFLADPALGRYVGFQLRKLELPEGVCAFLTQVGLPDCFADYRSPEEERERGLYPGVVFWLSCLRVERAKKKKLLVIGESRSLDRGCVISGAGTPDERWEWLKREDVAYIAVELKTGAVWKWLHDSFGDILTYVNTSLSQYLLSMACWRAFYPGFARKVQDFCARHPGKIDLDFIFKHEKSLYAPFWDTLRALDPEAAKKRKSYWKAMCDLSLY